MDIKKIYNKIFMKDFFPRFVIFIVGVFLLGLNYNLFLRPNHLVIGGMSGLSIVFESLLGWDPNVFLYISTFILLGLSFVFLGVKKTSTSIIGSILYPVFVSLTAPLAELLHYYIFFDNVVILILVTSILYGVGTGLIYKVGFDTGGSDIIMRILNKYCHLSEGKSSFATQILIILLDKIMIGISDSKLFFVYTKKWESVEDFIIKELQTGVTLLETEGGYSREKNKLLMCVVPNKDYYLFKEMILEIDPGAFLVIHDCYEVQGGMKRRNLPFI